MNENFNASSILTPSLMTDTIQEMPYCPPLTPLGDQLESIAISTRTLEANHERERIYSKQLRDHLNQLNQKVLELQKTESELRNQVSDFQKNERIISANLKTITSELASAREELARYRKVWSDVLAREQQARAIIVENADSLRRAEELRGRFQDLEHQWNTEKATREHLEKQTRHYQSELNQLRKQHKIAETRISQLSVELCELRGIREDFEKTLSAEKEKMDEKNHLEKEQVREQLEILYHQKLEKLKTENYTSLSEEKVTENEKTINTLSASLNTSKQEVAHLKKELDNLRMSSDEDKRLQESKIHSLQEEYTLIQTVLVEEKQNFKLLTEKVSQAWTQSCQNSNYDSLLTDLIRASEIQTLEGLSAPSEPL